MEVDDRRSAASCTPTYLYADPQNKRGALNEIVPFRSAARISARPRVIEFGVGPGNCPSAPFVEIGDFSSMIRRG
jgi:hypothetical protein